MATEFSLTDNCDYRAYEKLTVANASKALTATSYAPVSGTLKGRHAKSALINVETAPLRFRLDGTAPTTTEGTLMDIGDTILVRGEFNITNFHAIRTTGTSAVITVQYGF